MGAPRYVPQGTYWFISRRCIERRFLLRPGARENQGFLYCLALAAQRTGVEVLWTCAMSNHHHTAIYDPETNLSLFLQEFHRMLAKHHNALLGRWESLFASEPASAVRLIDASDILEKLLYALANPASAHLVEHAHQWPGAISLPHQLGETMTIRRPKTYFREQGNCPETIELTFAIPAPFCAMGRHAYQAMVAETLNQREAELQHQRRAAGKGLLGRKAVLAQSPYDNAQRIELRRGLRPTVAAKNRWRRIEALQRLTSFLTAYKEALLQWRTGLRDVVFPYGTYGMRRLHDVCVAMPRAP